MLRIYGFICILASFSKERDSSQNLKTIIIFRKNMGNRDYMKIAMQFIVITIFDELKWFITSNSPIVIIKEIQLKATDMLLVNYKLTMEKQKVDWRHIICMCCIVASKLNVQLHSCFVHVWSRKWWFMDNFMWPSAINEYRGHIQWHIYHAVPRWHCSSRIWSWFQI